MPVNPGANNAVNVHPAAFIPRSKRATRPR
jgi:hypothetical protein